MKRRAPEPKLCHFMTAPQPCAHCLHKHFYISQLVSKLWAVARYWATKTFPVGFISILNRLCVVQLSKYKPFHVCVLYAFSIVQRKCIYQLPIYHELLMIKSIHRQLVLLCQAL